MGFSDIFSDFYDSIGFTEVHAEAPPDEKQEDEGGDEDKGQDADNSEDAEGGEEGGEGGGEEAGGDDEGGGEEEEEEEEPEDPKPKLEEGLSLCIFITCALFGRGCHGPGICIELLESTSQGRQTCLRHSFPTDERIRLERILILRISMDLNGTNR